MAFLYINSKGTPWRKHSYSAGNDYDQSPIKYYLRRVLGWKEKDNKARFAFGHALEEAIQFHHDHDGKGAVEDFGRRWAAYKGKDMVFTDTEKNWETCLKIGTDMVRLYIVMQPKLPIPLGAKTVFQREYMKEVFPKDPNYGDIFDAGKLDVIAYVEASHPLLPKVDRFVGEFRPVIIDIKTSNMDFPETPGMAAHDNQLRRYSWLSGIRDVGLLWFKKSGLGYKRGYTVTFLEAVGGYQPGDTGIVAKVDGDHHLWIVKSDFVLTEMDKVQGKKGDKLDQTQEAKDKAFEWMKKFAVEVTPAQVTRQKLQFSAGRVSEKSAADAGQVAARQIIQIVNAWKDQNWPNTFGIRYPKDDRNDSYFRAFVLGDEKYKQNTFIKSDEQSLDDLFQEDEE